MANKYLSFISDKDLIEFTREVIEKSQLAADEAQDKIHSNVIDPFSALFDAARQGITVEAWLDQEAARQAQKSLQNALGKFHQQVLGAIPGWHDAGLGGSYDVGNDQKKIIAEIKNKHNTMNARSAADVYRQLQNHLQYAQKGYTAYLVEIVPSTRKPYDKPWSPNLTLSTLRDDIRKIDGRSFYDLATGKKDALEQLYQALPKVLESLIGAGVKKTSDSPLFTGLFSKAYHE